MLPHPRYHNNELADGRRDQKCLLVCPGSAARTTGRQHPYFVAHFSDPMRYRYFPCACWSVHCPQDLGLSIGSSDPGHDLLDDRHPHVLVAFRRFTSLS